MLSRAGGEREKRVYGANHGDLFSPCPAQTTEGPSAHAACPFMSHLYTGRRGTYGQVVEHLMEALQALHARDKQVSKGTRATRRL